MVLLDPWTRLAAARTRTLARCILPLPALDINRKLTKSQQQTVRILTRTAHGPERRLTQLDTPQDNSRRLSTGQTTGYREAMSRPPDQPERLARAVERHPAGFVANSP
jgi:hypothetical protein